MTDIYIKKWFVILIDAEAFNVVRLISLFLESIWEILVCLTCEWNQSKEGKEKQVVSIKESYLLICYS